MAVAKDNPVRNQVRSLRASRSLDLLGVLDLPEAVAAIRAGLRADLIRRLADQLDLSLEQVAVPLHLTERTLHRRIAEGRLDLNESERLLALVRIFALAKKTLGSQAKAIHWLKSPLSVLGGQTPLECAGTHIGLRELEDVLIRIEDVVYS